MSLKDLPFPIQDLTWERFHEVQKCLKLSKAATYTIMTHVLGEKPRVSWPNYMSKSIAYSLHVWCNLHVQHLRRLTSMRSQKGRRRVRQWKQSHNPKSRQQRPKQSLRDLQRKHQWLRTRRQKRKPKQSQRLRRRRKRRPPRRNLQRLWKMKMKMMKNKEKKNSPLKMKLWWIPASLERSREKGSLQLLYLRLRCCQLPRSHLRDKNPGLQLTRWKRTAMLQSRAQVKRRMMRTFQNLPLKRHRW